MCLIAVYGKIRETFLSSHTPLIKGNEKRHPRSGVRTKEQKVKLIKHVYRALVTSEFT